ncbi:MAG: DUF599 domain-containing protein [Gemmobacter sp.]
MIAALSTPGFTVFDLGAVGALLLVWVGLGWLIENPPVARPSVASLMAEVRREWMRAFVTRQPRIFDATVLDSLRQGTAFLASACMIALGGGVALLGNADRLAGVAADFTLNATRFVLEVKILLVMLFLANALLKFVWAHRLFGYCALMMASVPNDPEDPRCYPRAAQAAEINITAARSFNRGLHAVYFGMAAMAWLLGPMPLLLAVGATGLVMLRREFASRSRAVILGRS